ncbi:MAG: RuvB-like domain-containing protein [Candidatus Bathyarchaeota archaeon]|nr:RuvB-like domain-containing protein [Candidatus Bathyarchaeota archaeon]MCX8178138.1 RuvB-like domain-containing protein [Candidatus Bathyarchaeota archaeon]MDW8193938.1 RuvB-like domain-containing protein [Nitrososphaerota archaeon]
MASIRELPATISKFERIGAHTHIKGLGLDENLRAVKVKDGMVGQEKAREAAGLVVKMIKEGKLSGKCIILAGPPGTGKTAIAVAISKELGENVPFIQMSGSEIYSTERKKTEVLIEAIRKCIGVEVHEMRKVYEGEVTMIDIRTAPHPYNPYQKIPESVRLTLKTKDEEKTIEAGASIAQQIIAEGISEGHVIQIDAETGRVADLGLCLEGQKGKTYEVDTRKKIPRPNGKVLKEKEFVYMLTLADLDELNARQRSGGLFSLLLGGAESKEIDSEIRMAVDQQVKEWVDSGKGFIHPGVLFIDDAHLLDLEAFSFLGRAMESELVPIIILATNRGVATIRGTDIKSPLGFPLDLIDRAVIITTEPYDKESIKEILRIRSNEEKTKLENDALEKLAEVGAKSSLRYAVQMLSLAAQNAKSFNREKITLEDVQRVDELFMDVAEASEYLRKYEEKLLVH